ncbi:MAG: 2-methylcitrate dehydratase PrpD [Devosia sp.]|nr:2-methylcitrate dehydratase PrpD [Devosia sp.]
MIELRHFTQRLADNILQYPAQALSGALRSKALDCVLDNVAACLAGVSNQAALSARRMAHTTFARGGAPVWFAHSRFSPAGAAWCNSMAASSLDFDDGHRLARGHPGSAIVPAVLAEASQAHYSTPHILAAIAIGYEVAIAAAAAQQYDRAQTYQTGRWAGLGVVSACGYLVRPDRDQLANALAIAGVWAPNQQANGSSGYADQTGNWAKEGIPISTMYGLMALDLSRTGFTGPIDLLDHPSHYDFRHPIDISLDPGLIAETYFKRYACCRYIHPALDAYCALGNIEPASIARIEVASFGWALRLANKLRPETLVDAQYSLPFCLATLALYGPQALSPISQRVLGDDRIAAFAEKIHLEIDPSIDSRFPAETLASVRVILQSDTVLENEAAVGASALSSTDIREKFRAIADGRISESLCQQILGAVDPETCNINKLQLALAQAPSPGEP